MLTKKICLFAVAIFIILLCASCVSATTYSINNSTDPDTISKMIS
ncbi:hypothetical protein [Methanobrevibacter curvatus]|uniref:Uncharacterized protein n=1 Tax=Methanobrevibacter curvatus TaxID=49547 RepID=A0A166DWM6_9EURY|nr:hypothetical protein [Methanobrevibacter curvatus]KZX16029.1 hypothetical protein MBCUR_01330 [Methanobrevibacter curvatus]